MDRTVLEIDCRLSLNLTLSCMIESIATRLLICIDYYVGVEIFLYTPISNKMFVFDRIHHPTNHILQHITNNIAKCDIFGACIVYRLRRVEIIFRNTYLGYCWSPVHEHRFAKPATGSGLKK